MNNINTTKKYRNFIAEPMRAKPVTDLPGIGHVLGARLAQAGIDKSYVVLGYFLLFKKREEQFKEWLKLKCNANSKQSSDCYNCLKEWSHEFL
ncbi:barrier-to-autointegration factor-like [Haematobia irritans]|uniref:barrier-to-autointegration factor-like n=1 Tax=Haematobia irritans TaxID=7368 RepID=UPI003F5005D6